VGWAIIAEKLAHAVGAAHHGGRLGVCSRNVQPGDRFEGSDRMTQHSERGRLVPWGALVAALGGAALIIDASPREAQAQGRADVAIVDIAYQPGSILVQAGDTVTWTNTGSTPHTVTADDGSVGSGPLAPSASFSQIFPAAGLFTYHCAIHPQMTGAVTITRAPDPGGGTLVHQVPRTGTGTPVPTEPVLMALALGAATALGTGSVVGRRRTR
jgi:plastocyanin